MPTDPIVLLQMILLICNTLLLHAAASPTELLPRKSYSIDPWIKCDDPPPVSFPENYLASWYPHTLDLCSALNGAARNVGCVCHSSTSYPHCDEAVADPTLFSHRVSSTAARHSPFSTLGQYCTDMCYCTDTETAARARNFPLSSSSGTTPTTTSSVASRPTQRIQGVINVPYDPQGPNPFADMARPAYSIQADATANALGGAGKNWWANQCGTNCTSNADCAGGGSNCTCLAAQKGTFQPGVGTVAFVAACIVSMAKIGGVSGGGGGGGKRDVERNMDSEIWGCPCNSSYVSQSCCGVGDGLVWEQPEFKLGELVR